MRNPIIVALDLPTADEALKLAEQTSPVVGGFKIGSELFTSAGPEIVKRIRGLGSAVFLDLKFHDIPNSVRRAVESACALGVDMLTVHLSGGRSMCEAAVVGRGTAKTLILGVTVLTSLNDAAIAEIGYRTSVEDEVLLLADLAKNVGITGLVASPLELVAIRNRFGSLFTTVIPGIRPKWSETGDQSRMMTPGEALTAGADYLVIGRPITAASDPLEAVKRIVDELESAVK